MLPKVAVIYLCWKNLRHLPKVVESWTRLTYPPDRLTMVLLPAQSPDGIADVIRRDVLPHAGQDLPQVVLLDEPNRGFSANNNVGIRWALDNGFDYVFLHNGDLHLAPDCLDKLVAAMEADPLIGSAQPLVSFWHEQERVNVAGGTVHVAGYGYARDNGQLLADAAYAPQEDIVYASGAALLVRAGTLREVGLLEEGFFMYHDDLEFGLRLRIDGLRNVLVSGARAFHDYQFSRNPKKFSWTELYRWVVLLSFLRPATLLLLAPLLVAIEIGTWGMALVGGWLSAKWWAFGQWFHPRTWRLIWRIRRRAQRLRRIRDRVLLRQWTGRIEAQEQSNIFLERVANPVIDAIWKALRKCIVW